MGWALKFYAEVGDGDLGMETKVMKVKERHVINLLQKKRKVKSESMGFNILQGKSLNLAN